MQSPVLWKLSSSQDVEDWLLKVCALTAKPGNHLTKVQSIPSIDTDSGIVAMYDDDCIPPHFFWFLLNTDSLDFGYL